MEVPRGKAGHLVFAASEGSGRQVERLTKFLQLH